MKKYYIFFTNAGQILIENEAALSSAEMKGGLGFFIQANSVSGEA